MVMSYTTPDRLTSMLETQRAFQQRVASHTLYDGITEMTDEFGTKYYNVLDPKRIDEFKDMVLALQDELHEALGEIGWKNWSTSRHFNVEAVQGELVDAWCFLMSLMLLAGLDAPTLYRKYQEKMRINHKRQDDGYDAVSGKCPACKRAYDDPAVLCSPADEIGTGYCVRSDQLWHVDED